MEKSNSVEKLLKFYRMKKKMYERRLDNDLKKYIQDNSIPKFIIYGYIKNHDNKKFMLLYGNSKFQLQKIVIDNLGKNCSINFFSIDNIEYVKFFIDVLENRYSFKFSKYVINDDEKFEELENILFKLNGDSIVYILEPMIENNRFYGTIPIYKVKLKDAINIDPYNDIDLLDQKDIVIRNLRICKGTSLEDYKDPLYIYNIKNRRWYKKY